VSVSVLVVVPSRDAAVSCEVLFSFFLFDEEKKLVIIVLLMILVDLT
jgi:hypothetical protein